MKKTIVTLLVSFMVGTVMYSQDFTFNGVCYHLIDDNGEKCAEVEQGSRGLPEYNGTVVIPETVTYQGVNYKVTSFAFAAFSDYDDLTSITLPNTITHIGEEAFWGCINLTSITLPTSLISIESGAFADCGLTSVYIPRNVTSIYRNVFMSCSQLRSIVVDPNNSVYDSRENCNAIIQKEDDILMTGCMNTIVPSSVEQIGPYAFRGCVGLTSLQLPSGLGSIAFDAFSGCTNLNAIEFPSSVWSVGDEAFSGCTSLTSIHLPKRLTSLGENPFVGCSGITSITVDEGNYQYDSRNDCNAIIDKNKNELLTGCQNTIIPYGVEKIGKYAFKGCTSLTSIAIPASVTTIERDAFRDCTELISASVPNSVTKIRGGAFSGCTNLESFSIPDGITNLESIFNGCSKLKSIFIPAGVTKINSITFNDCNDLVSIIVDENNTVYDSRNNCNAVIETATNKLIGGCQTTIIPSDVTIIGSSAFEGCSNLTQLSIPDGVTTIERYAFEECTSLSGLVLPSNLNSLKENAFGGCKSLTEMVIPDEVTTLENYTFRRSGLTSITLPKALTAIGDLVFYETNIKSITFPETLEKIGYRAFAHCYQLESVTMKSPTPINIAEGTFDNISNITLYVPEGSKGAYEAADVWKNFKEIKEGVNPDDHPYLLGDANNDGKLTIADYTAIAHYILGKVPENFNEKAADVNGDGQINMADYIGVAHLLLYGTIEKPKN